MRKDLDWHALILLVRGHLYIIATANWLLMLLNYNRWWDSLIRCRLKLDCWTSLGLLLMRFYWLVCPRHHNVSARLDLTCQSAIYVVIVHHHTLLLLLGGHRLLRHCCCCCCYHWHWLVAVVVVVWYWHFMATVRTYDYNWGRLGEGLLGWLWYCIYVVVESLNRNSVAALLLHYVSMSRWVQEMILMRMAWVLLDLIICVWSNNFILFNLYGIMQVVLLVGGLRSNRSFLKVSIMISIRAHKF